MLQIADVGATVATAVAETQAIDVHTHLLPPSHGSLMLWGIDALLTYHYLVAELFMVLPCEQLADTVTTTPDAPPSPDIFHAWPIESQADLVFEELFVKRTPLSEACRGVITAMSAMGLSGLLREAAEAPRPSPWPPQPSASRLVKLRARFGDLQANLDDHLEFVFANARLKYAVMTNIPFSPEEAQHWRKPGMRDQPLLKPLSKRLKPALRVDPLLSGDWVSVCAALRASCPPYEETVEGCKEYLSDWVRLMRPVYLMASTPHGFTYTPSRKHRKRPREGDEAAAANADAGSKPARPDATTLFEDVLLAVAAEHGLPLAIKVGAVRGANPALRAGGDGVEVADLRFLRALLVSYPHIKVLATVLSRDNQHELAVLARKFGNLHVYGCWWFCNNPSIIEETTRMRLEMLGTAFTCQHSDSRVLEQLLYKVRYLPRSPQISSESTHLGTSPCISHISTCLRRSLTFHERPPPSHACAMLSPVQVATLAGRRRARPRRSVHAPHRERLGCARGGRA